MPNFDDLERGSPLPDDHDAWGRLLDAVGPDSILVLIDGWLGPRLRAHTSAEDIWAETLELAWRDRAKCTWHGIKAFKQWVLQIAKNRIHDANKHMTARKRGGGKAAEPMPSASGCEPPVPQSFTSLVILRERAESMRRALERLPEDLRAIVRARLLEDLPMDQVARELGIPSSTAWYRFRKGIELYAASLKELSPSLRAPRKLR